MEDLQRTLGVPVDLVEAGVATPTFRRPSATLRSCCLRQPETLKDLFDILEACRLLDEFTSRKTLADYSSQARFSDHNCDGAQVRANRQRSCGANDPDQDARKGRRGCGLLADGGRQPFHVGVLCADDDA